MEEMLLGTVEMLAIKPPTTVKKKGESMVV